MYVYSRIFQRLFRRSIVGAILALALFAGAMGTLVAGTTGTINGTVTDVKSGTPLEGVTVAAVSPTGRYSTTTDKKGFFSFIGVSVDTYNVSFELKGFQSFTATGVNVFSDSVIPINTTLSKSLATIGRVSVRSQAGAYQPSQTQDTTTVTVGQIQTDLGKTDAISETNLLLTLPGATKDSSGYPVIRGGRENEEGFQYEGIPYTDAFTNQFVNSLGLNPGIGSLQLTPGAGDASVGNNGTGTINITSKRGTYPSFGTLEFDALGYPFSHQLSFEYGFATPNGAFSNYLAFTGQRAGATYGARGSDALTLSRFYLTTQYSTANLFTDNLVFKFGRNQNQSVQLFYENDDNHFYFNNGGLSFTSPFNNDGLISTAPAGTSLGLFYPTADPYALANLSAFTGLPIGTVGSTLPGTIAGLTALDPYQANRSTTQLDRADNQSQPNEAFKIQYTNNFDSSTFLTTKYYKVNSVSTFDRPQFGTYYGFTALQGGLSTGVTLDLTKQINAKNLVKIGAQRSFLHPVFNEYSPGLGVLAISPFGVGAPEAADFAYNTATPSKSGYLYTGNGGNPFFAGNSLQIPAFLEVAQINRQDYAFYLDDSIQASDRLKVEAGVRFDGTNYKYPSAAPCNAYTAAGLSLDNPANGGSNQCMYRANGVDSKGNPTFTFPRDSVNPLVFEPRFAFSYQFTKRDDIRASYGRSVEFAPLGDVDLGVSRSLYSTFAGVPAKRANCGVTGTNACLNYGDELFWANQNNIEGTPIQPAAPETFNNYDFSISHQFANGLAVKLTPFYSQGYNAIAQAQLPRLDATGNPLKDLNGNVLYAPPITTNLGISKKTGVEFLLTKESAYGFSGQVSATYINELTNVPPLSASEDFFPTIPLASLLLGNVYRVGFLTPFQATGALQYKTHSGFRINPVITYNRGYPIGNGTITQKIINGTAYNIPNTNASAASSSATQQYVDPLNPGSLLKPNVDAQRGGALGPSAGSVLSIPNINTNLTLEYSAPNSKSTFGVLVTNLFGNVYGVPSLNSRYQPVASGIAGPRTGYSTTPLTYPLLTQYYYGNNAFGNQAFIDLPNLTPTTFRFYYQLTL